ncbi:hypothetical protein NC653_006348 [Populus alba x Populus x berolinensis]|uniref:Uncharacterized protein n=1 Tax=Populus alba x Populus x berolinensis TaxID=444605 RepID=A0AAD6WCZ4_9ROSI|nr:hypothetical protein NC653_035359 [Populus alba x Populus x berolinensis]KAJ6978785.1 hypothetical protein NC653_027061 [Populus alba x Populus x berolinensis]KAJ7006665.1 hypothetical protein NC653_005887 [Populus alba x Populus x berolinensis]KAJ7007266.1 hypothetical protein NC653_006348 [Populus alba x Populus x berolinensis]
MEAGSREVDRRERGCCGRLCKGEGAVSG